ncbi:MAG: hypothetical protein HQL55_18420 [Magnetococcales bacterium]|nr:hypothetical protein [Magnetococcales bacterium]
MAIDYQDNQAIMSDVCTVEEADGFLAWLRDHPQAEVDMAACTHIHTAILQVVMALSPKIVAFPEQVFLSRVMQSLGQFSSPPGQQ